MHKPFDFAALDTKTAADQGTVVTIENPVTDEPLTDSEGQPVTITVLGSDSAKLTELLRKNGDRRLDRMRKQRDFVVDNVATVERRRIERLVAATIAWSGVGLNGQVLECTEANAWTFYSDPRWPWLLDQLDKAIDDRKRFFLPASGT